MTYSQGIAPYYDLFRSRNDPPNAAGLFVGEMITRDATVLDIGAGTGNVTFALAELGARVTALEPDTEMHAVLLARLATRYDLASRVTPVPGGTGFAFAKAFDICCCFQVLHLVDEPMQRKIVDYAASQLSRETSQAKLVIQFAVESNTTRDWP